MTQAEQIQGVLRERVTDLDNHILTKEGVYAEINLEEGGLNEAEGSYGGVHPNTWNEYKETFALQVTLNKPADFENITPEAAAMHIVNFKDWYFQKPPKQDFFALPSLLWLVACDNAYLAPAPVISRIQMLCGDPNPDGIWGSGTTELVKGFFYNQTAPAIVKFAKALTDLMVKRYEELGGYDAYADSAPHWIERCKRKLQMLYDYVSKQNELADAEDEDAEALDDAPVEDNPIASNSEVRGKELKHVVSPISATPEIVELIRAQSNHIVALGVCIDKQIDLGENIAQRVGEQSEATKEHSDIIEFLAKAIEAQGNVIAEMKDALLSHITTQEQILKKLLEDTSTDELEQTNPGEQPLAKQAAGRDLLNEVPDSLVRS